jgi:hypothetical protein
MKNFIKYLLLLVALHVGISGAYAVTPAAGLVQEAESGVSYANGGIGDEQREELKAIRKDFNLELTFAAKRTGEFVADVDIHIENTSGKEMLDVSNMGPQFLAKLPAGTYRIKATYQGKSQTKTISISKHGIKDLYFYW